MNTTPTFDDDPSEVDFSQISNMLAHASSDQLQELREDITAELEQRQSDTDLGDAKSIDVVNETWARWRTLSAHPNLKAVKPWIMHVTGEHQQYTVDGEWLQKQRIDGDYHMDVSDLEAGDIIKVSGASHNNRKHRYYRVLALTDETLYYERISESDALEEVA